MNHTMNQRDSADRTSAGFNSFHVDNQRRLLLSTAGVFCVFLIIFLSLRSNNYTSVDGPLRCLEVFHRNRMFFHGNNHMLYPFWIFAWYKLSGLLGINAADAFHFIRISQAMNAFAAAASIGMLYFLMREVSSARAALLGTLLFSLSTATMLHATNCAEVMPGFFFAMLALTVLASGLSSHSKLMLTFSGGCLAVALASYEAMGTTAVIAGFMCCFCPIPRQPSGRTAHSSLMRLSLVAVGGTMGICIVYGLAYWAQGVAVADMPSRFLALPGNEVYGGFKIARIFNVPFGLIRNLNSGVPDDYAGIRFLVHVSQRAFWIPLVLANLLLLTAILIVACRGLWRLAGSFGRIWAGLAVIPCTALVFPLLYWDPIYDKLWLLPLAALTFLLVISLRPDATSRRPQSALWILLSALLFIEAFVNVPRIVREHSDETPNLSDAKKLASIVRADDWVVLDFDDVSALWLNVWGFNSNHLMLPASTLPQASEWLENAKRAHKTENSRILFIGVLDQDRKTWDAFLGQRVGIPFDSLNQYRGATTILDTYEFRGHPLTVREFTGK